MKKDVLDALKHIGVALLGALTIYLSSLIPFLLFIVPALVCGAGGWFAAGKDSEPKVKRNTALAWGAIGLAAGIGFYIAL